MFLVLDFRVFQMTIVGSAEFPGVRGANSSLTTQNSRRDF